MRSQGELPQWVRRPGRAEEEGLGHKEVKPRVWTAQSVDNARHLQTLGFEDAPGAP